MKTGRNLGEIEKENEIVATNPVSRKKAVVFQQQPLTEYEVTSGNGSLSQDDPRLLALIKADVLLPPSPLGKGVAVNWTVWSPVVYPTKDTEQHKLSRYILDLFNKKVQFASI